MDNNRYTRLKKAPYKLLMALSLVLSLCSQKVMATVTPPVVDSVVHIYGNPSDTVNIYGSAFNDTTTRNIVTFGATRATVLTATATQLVVTVPVSATFDVITVMNLTGRLAAQSAKQFHPTYINSCFQNTIFNFKAPIVVSGPASSSVVVGSYLKDLDGDGKPELIFSNAGTDSLTIYKNTSTPGSLSYTRHYPSINPTTGLVNVKSADLDGDGKPELITALRNGRIDVIKNTNATIGTISMNATPILLNAAYGTTEVATADFDGDGKIDIAGLNSGIPIGTSGFAAGVPGTITIARNQITAVGTYTSAAFSMSTISLPTTSTHPWPQSFFVTDFDFDGKPDIVVSDSTSRLIVLRNTSTVGSISFSVAGVYTCGSGNLEVQAGDIDGDGKPDLAVANGNENSISVFLNTSTTGSVSFSSRVDFSVGTAPLGLSFGDINGDNKMDIIVSNNGSFNVTILRNTATAGSISSTSFATGVNRSVSGGPLGVTIGDIDGDSKPDIITSNYASNTFSILRNYPLPYVDTIRGNTFICTGVPSSFTDSITGGIWSVTNTAVATIDPVTGAVTPVSVGADTVVYTFICNGDSAVVRKAFSVNVSPVAGTITEPSTLCNGLTATLTESVAGGVWTASGAGTIASTGVLTGVSVGTALITYSNTNACGSATAYGSVTILNSPTPLTGTFHECMGSNTSIGETVTGGTWGIVTGSAYASISSSGVVTGSIAGVAVVTYTLSDGCSVTANDTVLAVPNSLSGAGSVCTGASTGFFTTSTGGNWSVTPTSLASVNTSGSVTGIAAGSVTVSYTYPGTGCATTASLTVNTSPAAITGGGGYLCAGGSSLSLGETTTGGSWSSSPTIGLVSVSPTGTVTSVGTATGMATISYNNSGCYATTTVNVILGPGPINGPGQVCAGSSIALTDTAMGGSWAITPTYLATIGSSGVVSAGFTPGSVVVSYTYLGCTTNRTVTINPNPLPISGGPNVCQGVVTNYSDASLFGTWSLDTTGHIATVDVTGGVTGHNTGSVILTYTLPTTCYAVSTVNVVPSPTPIYGNSYVCMGAHTTLHDTTSGGYFTSSATTYATVDSITGVVAGIAVGGTVITYTEGPFNCYSAWNLSVDPTLAPSVTYTSNPPMPVCAGTPITFTAHPTNGGTAPIYQWYVNHVAFASDSVYTYTPFNNDSIVVELNSSLNCVTAASVYDTGVAHVNPILSPSVNISTGGVGDTVCVGNPLTLSPVAVNGGTAPVYNWMVNGVFVWPGTSYTYVPATGDIVVLKMVSNAICPVPAIVYDTLPLTVSPFLTPSVTVTGSTTICQGYPGLFHAIQVNGGTAPTYQWLVNTTPSGTGSTFSYTTPATGDIIKVNMTSNFPCLLTTTASSVPETVTVLPVQLPTVSISVTPGTIVAPGMMAHFTATVTNGGASPTYQWTLQGVPIPGATNLTYFTPSSGFNSTDTFSFFVTNHDQCNGITAYGTIKMYKGYNVGVGQTSFDASEVSLMPNPTSGSINLTGTIVADDDEEISVEILDMLGRTVQKGSIMAIAGKIDAHLTLGENITNGVYSISLHSNHLGKVIKFVVEK